MNASRPMKSPKICDETNCLNANANCPMKSPKICGETSRLNSQMKNDDGGAPSCLTNGDDALTHRMNDDGDAIHPTNDAHACMIHYLTFSDNPQDDPLYS